MLEEARVEQHQVEARPRKSVVYVVFQTVQATFASAIHRLRLKLETHQAAMLGYPQPLGDRITPQHAGEGRAENVGINWLTCVIPDDGHVSSSRRDGLTCVEHTIPANHGRDMTSEVIDTAL